MLAGIWILTSAASLFLTTSPVFAAPTGVDSDEFIVSRQNVPAIGSGPATATDGSTIIENQVVINGLNMRFKVSAPSSELVSTAGVKNGSLGINVLLHGDGGRSFFDFPNQGVKSNLMGVALLSPDPRLRWGGSGGGNNPRPQGAAHSAAVNQFLTTELPKIVNFDKTKIFMEGISGGSLLLSGFMVPTFGASLGVQGVIMGCGGLAPQVQVQGNISDIRIHWQSTVNELASLKRTITQGITAYEKLATDAGLNAEQINRLQTADASPNGGHCAFDQRGFVSGVQLLTDNYGTILAGQGQLNGVNVVKGVVGNENLFGAAAATGAGAGAGAGANANAVAASGAAANTNVRVANTANTAGRVNTANRTANRVNTSARVNTANRNRVAVNTNRVASNRNRVAATNGNRVAAANRNRVATNRNRVAATNRDRVNTNTGNRNRVTAANRNRNRVAAGRNGGNNRARPAAGRGRVNAAGRGRVNRVNQ